MPVAATVASVPYLFTPQDGPFSIALNTDLTVLAGAIGSAGSTFGGNPTAQVGLSTINGSAVSFMRSDAAPPLNQGIAPVWTSVHDFSAGLETNTISGNGGAITITPGASNSLFITGGANVGLDNSTSLFWKNTSGSYEGILNVDSSNNVNLNSVGGTLTMKIPSAGGVSMASAGPQITLGANSGNAGEITFEGSTSGSTSITATAAGALTVNGGVTMTSAGPQITLGANSGNAGELALAGSTSGAATLTASSAGALTVNVPSSETITLEVNGTAALTTQSSGGISIGTASDPGGSGLGVTNIFVQNVQVSADFATGNTQTIASSQSVTATMALMTAAATLTLPGSPIHGQHLWLKMAAAVATVSSASSNVVPVNSTTAGTAIFVSGGLTKFAHLVYDGTNWQIMEGA